MKVGDLVRSRYAGWSRGSGRIGIVIKLREGAYEDQPLAQVFWTHRGDAGWVEAKDMEVVNENR